MYAIKEEEDENLSASLSARCCLVYEDDRKGFVLLWLCEKAEKKKKN